MNFLKAGVAVAALMVGNSSVMNGVVQAGAPLSCAMAPNFGTKERVVYDLFGEFRSFWPEYSSRYNLKNEMTLSEQAFSEITKEVCNTLHYGEEDSKSCRGFLGKACEVLEKDIESKGINVENNRDAVRLLLLAMSIQNNPLLYAKMKMKVDDVFDFCESVLTPAYIGYLSVFVRHVQKAYVQDALSRGVPPASLGLWWM